MLNVWRGHRFAYGCSADFCFNMKIEVVIHGEQIELISRKSDAMQCNPGTFHLHVCMAIGVVVRLKKSSFVFLRGDVSKESPAFRTLSRLRPEGAGFISAGSRERSIEVAHPRVGIKMLRANMMNTKR